MKLPTNLTANFKSMSAEMLAEHKEAQLVKWDEKLSDEEANAKIKAFNARWIAAGGSEALTIALR